MTKIKQIEVSNLKAIDLQKIDLNGCSVIVTGANRKGKTTLLQGMIDRIRGLRPTRAVRTDEKEGRGLMVLDNGETFKWEFDIEGKDKLVYLTKDGYQSRVTKEIANKYFPEPFSIDEFVMSPPRLQLKMLAKLVGLDFEEIDAEYTEAYNARTVANKAEQVAKIKWEEVTNIPDKVDYVDSKSLVEEKRILSEKRNEQYLENKSENEKRRGIFDKEKDAVREEVRIFNGLQDERKKQVEEANEAMRILNGLGYEGLEVARFITAMPTPMAKQIEEVEIGKLKVPEYITPELPDDKDILLIDEKINGMNSINQKAKDWADYQELKKDYDVARQGAENADATVKEVEARKRKMIADANFPKGIEYGDEGVLVDGMVLNEQNLSTSQKYMAAIRMGALKLGEVKSLHFDASTLDKKSLLEIESWAANFEGVEGGLQLMVERPSWEDENIKYEIIETN